jgi:hypothetical protein
MRAAIADPSEPGVMNAEQLGAFGEALGIDVFSDVAILIIAHLMEAKSLGKFSKAEFVKGFQKMG